MLSFGAKYRKKKEEAISTGERAFSVSKYRKNNQPLPEAYQPVEKPLQNTYKPAETPQVPAPVIQPSIRPTPSPAITPDKISNDLSFFGQPEPNAKSTPVSIEKTNWPEVAKELPGAVKTLYKKATVIPRLLIPGEREKVIREQPQDVIDQVEAYERYVTPFVRRGITKIPLAIAEKIVGKQLAPTYEEISKKYPFTTAMIGLTGDLYNLSVMTLLTGGIGDAIKVPAGIKILFPTLSRYVPKAIEGGITFGSLGLIDETVNQFQKGRFEPGKLASKTGINFLFGTMLAYPMSLRSVPKQILGSGTVMGGFSLMEGYLRDGKIDRNDLLNSGMNAVLGMAFASLGVRRRVSKMAQEDIYNLAHQQLVVKVGETNAKLMEQAQLATLLGKEYPNKTASQIMEMVGTMPKGYTYSKLPTIIERQINLPQNLAKVKSMSSGEQSKFVSQIIQNTKNLANNGEPLWSAIVKSFQEVGIPMEKMGEKAIVPEKTPIELRKQIIENKDKITQPENIGNQELKDKLTQTGTQLSDYEQANKENIISAKRPDGNGNAVEINVIPVGKQWAYDYSANTGTDGISAGSISNDLKDTKEEAIASARKEITDWVNKSLPTAQGEERTELTNIIDQMKVINKKKEDNKALIMAGERAKEVARNSTNLLDFTEKIIPLMSKDKYVGEFFNRAGSTYENNSREAGAVDSMGKPAQDITYSFAQFFNKWKTEKPIEPKIPKELEPLAEEARKYNSAKKFEDAFVLRSLWQKLRMTTIQHNAAKEFQEIKAGYRKESPIKVFEKHLRYSFPQFKTLEDFYNQVAKEKRPAETKEAIPTEKPKEVKTGTIDNIVDDYKTALRDEYSLSEKGYKRDKRSGGITYGEGASNLKQRISNLNRQFATEFYRAYKAKFGEYPIGFVSLSDSWFEWKNNTDVFVVADFGQAETDTYKYEIYHSIDELLNAANKLKNRGRSSEIIQSDIQYQVEKTRPAETSVTNPEIKPAEKPTEKPVIAKKVIVKTKEPRFAKAKIATKKLPENTEKNRIGIIKKFIGRGNPTLPILSKFLVDNGKAISTDLNISIRLNTGLSDGVYDIVGKEAVKSKTKKDDFPIVPEVKDQNITELDNAELSNAIKNAIISVSKNEVRPEIAGISIKMSKGKIEIVSTDSFRMYRKVIKAKVKNEGSFILSSVKKLNGALRSLGDSVDIETSKDFVKISGERGDIVDRKVVGNFPEYNVIYPALTDQYSFDKKQLLNILKELKPFTSKVDVGISFKIKENEIILSAKSKIKDSGEEISKEFSIPVKHKEISVNQYSPQEGTVIMPIMLGGEERDKENIDLMASVDYLIDAVKIVDSEEINLCKNKEKLTPFIVKGDEKLVSLENGTDHSIDKGTPLFHGTTANNATSIISDGLNKTEDKTATYGKAVYLTPDYQSAQDYANEIGNGQVVTIKTKEDLNLYEPTIKEREELVSLVGERQEKMIKTLLNKKKFGIYDGLYIPDDGRGDGGEQVILYNDDPENFEKAVLADEPRTDNSKVVKRIPSGNAASAGGKLGEFEKLARESLKRKRGKKLTRKEIAEQIKDNKKTNALWDKMSEYDKNYLFNLLTFPERKLPKARRVPSGLASTGGNDLGSFEDLAGLPKPTPDQLKIYEEVKALIQKYAKTIGEGYLPSNALGVYYNDTKNIRISGMNNISVAAHEITHFLDFAYKISDKLMGIKGYASNGNPLYDKSTAKLRKEMTDLYERYYPGGKRTHKLRKRMLEGFATMLQKYIEQPSTISATYPNIIKEFLSPEGKYYKPIMSDIINDLRDIISRYQGLDALDKIGARVVNGKVNVNKDSFLNFFQKVKTEIADNVYPIELLAKKAGVRFTKVDPSLWIRQYNSSSALILNNINGNRGYWSWRNGELMKLHDFNFKDIIADVKKAKLSNEFGFYLVARKEYFDYQELSKLKIAYDQAKELKEGGFVSAGDPKGVELDEEINAYLKLKSILDNDGLTEDEVTEAYLQNKDKFKKYEEKFDILVNEDLKFLNDPAIQLIDKEQLDKMESKSGYASLKRAFYDEVVGEKEVSLHRVRFGSTKVSSLLQRTGSQKPIINPLFSALTNHAEITRKGLKQLIYNRIAGIAVANPDFGLFQKLQLKGIPDRTGRISYPQEKDPNIIMARINYKRVPFLTDSLIKKTIDELLDFHNIHNFEKILMGASRFFTKGTTGLFPAFALTNYEVDQATAIAQTRNNYIPLYDPLKRLIEAFDSNNPEHIYLQEYLIMGGERQTFVGWQDMSPNELFDAISNEKAGLSKVIDYINSGADILAIPSKWSEIATRATEYMKSRQAGNTPVVALEEAGRVTAPFHHIGRWGGGRVGQTYIKSIPFFSPAIQVLAQAIETLETREGRIRYALVVAAITAASIGSLGLIIAFGSDEQKQLYADIHPDELNKYIWLPNPDGKSLIKIRVPDQMTIIATLVNMMWADKKLKANYTAGEYLTAGVSWLPQELDPSDPARALISWMPQVIKPGVLTLANTKDFPTIMPLESEAQKNKPAGLRYNGATSVVAKWIGEKLNLSPIKIDYLLNGYVGRVSGYFTGKPGIYNPLRAMSRKYYFSSGRRVQSYYNTKQKNDQDYYAYKHKLKKFNFRERSAIIRKRKELQVIGKLMGDYRAVDLDKKPERAAKLRIKILDKILKLK